jgi:hypothetical protein
MSDSELADKLSDKELIDKLDMIGGLTLAGDFSAWIQQ